MSRCRAGIEQLRGAGRELGGGGAGGREGGARRGGGGCWEGGRGEGREVADGCLSEVLAPREPRHLPTSGCRGSPPPQLCRPPRLPDKYHRFLCVLQCVYHNTTNFATLNAHNTTRLQYFARVGVDSSRKNVDIQYQFSITLGYKPLKTYRHHTTTNVSFALDLVLALFYAPLRPTVVMVGPVTPFLPFILASSANASVLLAVSFSSLSCCFFAHLIPLPSHLSHIE